MAANERRGPISRAWSAVRRLILGKSDPDYAARLAGGSRYWDEAIEAQLGWPGPAPRGSSLKPPQGRHGSGDATPLTGTMPV